MGEQVAGAAGYGWLDGVRADLAGEGFASRVVDIPACAVDAPHIRQRLYWIAVGDTEGGGWAGAGRSEAHHGAPWGRQYRGSDAGCGLVNSPRLGRGEGRPEHELRSGRPAIAGADAQGVTLGDAFGPRLEGQPRHGDGGGGRPGATGSVAAADGGGLDVADGDSVQQGAERGFRAGAFSEPSGDRRRNGSFWSDAEWLACHDGKARRTKPGLRLLVDGLPGRVGLWRIAGNAVVAPLAAEVIAAFLDTERAAA